MKMATENETYYVRDLYSIYDTKVQILLLQVKWCSYWKKDFATDFPPFVNICAKNVIRLLAWQ